jgi:methyl-accepting chemotaxis protein
MRDTVIEAARVQAEQERRQVEVLFAEKMQTARALASWVAEDKDVAAAFANRDREALLTRLLPIFDALKGPLNLSQFQFHLPPATSFLRLHKPEKYGDDLSKFRPTVLRTNESTTAQVGLDGGAAGLGLRGVVPVFHQGVHVGSVEFGIAVNNDLILPLKEESGFDISILTPKGDGFDFIAKTHGMPVVPSMAPTLRQVYDSGRSLFKRVNKAGKQLYTAYFPLNDYTGKTIGVLAIPTDISNSLAAIHSLLLKTVGVGLLALLVSGVLVGVIVKRIIGRPLNSMLLFFGKLAGGDYSDRLGKGYCCEMGVLADGVNTMTDAVADAMKQAQQAKALAVEEGEKVKGALAEAEAQKERVSDLLSSLKRVAKEANDIAQEVASASEELSAQVEEVNQGTIIQSERTDETATAMEEMNATVLEVARNSSSAAESAGAARTEAAEGQKVVSQAVEAIQGVSERALELKEEMSELGKQTDGISRILDVISDIADQTNLLALNAAIEAARAGDAGRGFAVVADEVRKLAEKTMTATKEVGDAINQIQQGAHRNIASMDSAAEAVGEATELANQSGAALQQIVQLVVNASDEVRSIATAAEEQSAASEEISRAVEDISRIATETRGGMDKSANAVVSLTDLAQQLQRLIEEMNQL